LSELRSIRPSTTCGYAACCAEERQGYGTGRKGEEAVNFLKFADIFSGFLHFSLDVL